MKTKAFTEEQFLREIKCGGFLAVYKFWRQLKEIAGPVTEPALTYGDGVLRGMGMLCYDAREGKPASPQEREAFEYLGWGKAEPGRPPEGDQILLGEILSGQQAFADVAYGLTADDFDLPEHKEIFRAMAALCDRGEPVEIVTVANELMKENRLEACGSLTYLHKLRDWASFEELRS